MNMKKLQFIGAIVIAVSFVACGGDAKSTDTSSPETTEPAETKVEDYKGMELANLSDYGVDGSLQIPDKSKGPQKIQTSSIESIEIMVGNAFGIEVITFGQTVAEKKTELDGDLVYRIEYIEETPEKLLYKKTLKDSDIDPEFHFYLTKNINGELFSVQSLNKVYKQKWVEKMIVSAESLTANNPA